MVDYSAQFQEFYIRDVNALINEIKAYKDEANMWKTSGNISNSAGNLTLHLIGNLNHFFGATLGNTGYVRERDLEFSTKGVARRVLIDELDKTMVMLTQVFSKLNNEELEKTYPVMKNDKEETTAHFLIHLYGHLAYHLGQVNYHRRLIDL